MLQVGANATSYFHCFSTKIARSKKRFHLFNATVTKAALWNCGAWAITEAWKRWLDVTQNNMLRQMGQEKRRPSILC